MMFPNTAMSPAVLVSPTQSMLSRVADRYHSHYTVTGTMHFHSTEVPAHQNLRSSTKHPHIPRDRWCADLNQISMVNKCCGRASLDWLQLRHDRSLCRDVSLWRQNCVNPHDEDDRWLSNVIFYYIAKLYDDIPTQTLSEPCGGDELSRNNYWRNKILMWKKSNVVNGLTTRCYPS